MEISSFYYLEYPDHLPEDLLVAACTAYVEISDQNSRDSGFRYASCVAVELVTIGYIEKGLREDSVVFIERAIVVKSLEPAEVNAILTTLLPNLAEMGVVVE